MTTHTNTGEQPALIKVAITNGLIWAFIKIILFLFAYYVAPDLLSNIFYGVFSFGVSIVLAIYFIKDIQRKLGGYWTFRIALKHIFLLFFVQIALTTVFDTAFGKWIEPTYTDMRLEEVRNQAVESAESMYSDQDQIDNMVEQAESWSKMLIDPDFKAFTAILSILAIFYFIGAMIFAAIFKRERPIFINPEEWKPEGGNEPREQP